MPNPMRRPARFLLIVFVLALVAAACGDDEAETTMGDGDYAATTTAAAATTVPQFSGADPGDGDNAGAPSEGETDAQGVVAVLQPGDFGRSIVYTAEPRSRGGRRDLGRARGPGPVVGPGRRALRPGDHQRAGAPFGADHQGAAGQLRRGDGAPRRAGDAGEPDGLRRRRHRAGGRPAKPHHHGRGQCGATARLLGERHRPRRRDRDGGPAAAAGDRPRADAGRVAHPGGPGRPGHHRAGAHPAHAGPGVRDGADRLPRAQRRRRLPGQRGTGPGRGPGVHRVLRGGEHRRYLPGGSRSAATTASTSTPTS